MYVFPTMPSLWPVVHNLIPVHCITAFCSDALVIWAQPLSAHGFKWLVLVQKNSLSFRPCFVPRSIFFQQQANTLPHPQRIPLKFRGPRWVPARFQALCLLRGSLEHFPRLEIHFSLKSLELVDIHETVSKTRAITLKLLNQLNRYYPREILMFDIYFLHVLRRNVINKYHAVQMNYKILN